MKKVIILITLLLANINLYSQIKTYLDTNIIMIGSKFSLNVELTVNKKDKVELFSPKDTLSNFDVIGVKLDTIIKGEQIIYKENITLFGAEQGSLYINPINFIINDDTISTNKIPIIVLGVEVDTTKPFFDIKPIASMPYSIGEILIFVSYGVLGLATLILIIYLLFFNKNKQAEKQAKLYVPPFILAKENLSKLQQKGILEQGLFKQYYTELIDILREYLGNEFNIDAMEFTSEQIIDEIKNNISLDSEFIVHLKDVLHKSDLVKFAKMTPIIAEAKQDFLFIREFIFKLNSKIEKVKENGTH